MDGAQPSGPGLCRGGGAPSSVGVAERVPPGASWIFTSGLRPNAIFKNPHLAGICKKKKKKKTFRLFCDGGEKTLFFPLTLKKAPQLL